MRMIILTLASLLYFANSVSYLNGWVTHNINSIEQIFEGATFTESCETGEFDMEYDISYYNRQVARLLIENRFFGEPTFHVEYLYRTVDPDIITLEDLMRKPWPKYHDTYGFIWTEENLRFMHRHYRESNVHELMYIDKYEGGVPWPVAWLADMVESASGTSGLARVANNHFGRKCFSHSKRVHTRWANAANGNNRLAITAAGDTTCIYVGKDDHHHDHFKYYSKVIDSRRDYSRLIRSNTRYGWFRDIPFNNDLVVLTIQMYGADVDAPMRWKNGKRQIYARDSWKNMKKVYYRGQEIQHGDKLLVTGVDAWFIGLSASGYATDPHYADKFAERYFAMFKDWSLEDFLREEDYELGLHYQKPLALLY